MLAQMTYVLQFTKCVNFKRSRRSCNVHCDLRMKEVVRLCRTIMQTASASITVYKRFLVLTKFFTGPSILLTSLGKSLRSPFIASLFAHQGMTRPPHSPVQCVIVASSRPDSFLFRCHCALCVSPRGLLTASDFIALVASCCVVSSIF